MLSFDLFNHIKYGGRVVVGGGGGVMSESKLVEELFVVVLCGIFSPLVWTFSKENGGG